MQRATNADRERLSREIRLALRKDRHDAEIPGCREIREGREEGWDKFYEHYIPVVTSIVRRAGTTEILGDNSSSEDIAYEVLAKFYHHSPTLLKAQDFSTDGQVVAYLKKMVEGWQVNGVYFNIIRNCDIHGYEIPELRDYFEMMGLPVLVIEQDYSTTALEPLRTRFQAFAESLG